MSKDRNIIADLVALSFGALAVWVFFNWMKTPAGLEFKAEVVELLTPHEEGEVRLSDLYSPQELRMLRQSLSEEQLNQLIGYQKRIAKAQQGWASKPEPGQYNYIAPTSK